MNFISESDVEEAKKKRSEEWRKAREEGREIPEEDPEEIRDTRTLYEKLKEQKDRKQEEFEDKLKFKNMIYKGLDETDAEFLNEVAERQAAMDGKRFEIESAEVAEFRAAAEKLHSQQKPTEDNGGLLPKKTIADEYRVNKKSQAALLASAIIRKRKSSPDPHDEVVTSSEKVSRVSRDEKTPGASLDEVNSSTNGKEMSVPSSLSLLAEYPSSDSEEESE